jgi:hypothetical protein
VQELDTKRYRMRLRGHGLGENAAIPSLVGDDKDEVGTWDTVEKRWVKRNAAGEWVPE